MPAAEQVPEPGRGVPLLRAPRQGEEAGACGRGGGGGEVGQEMACWGGDKVLLPESGEFGASPGATGRGLPPPPSSQRAAKEVWGGGMPCLFYLGAACCPPPTPTESLSIRQQ